MQKIISFLVVATIAIPFTFAASGDSTPALTPTPKVTQSVVPQIPHLEQIVVINVSMVVQLLLEKSSQDYLITGQMIHHH